MDISEVVNWTEVILWPSMGIACLIGSKRKHGHVPRMIWILAVAFFVFGLSDYIELGTGGWWKPWWLLLMKASCIVVFLIVAIDYNKKNKKPKA